MNTNTASALIVRHLTDGLIDRDTAAKAQDAIRAAWFGNALTDATRARMLATRFGIAA